MLTGHESEAGCRRQERRHSSGQAQENRCTIILLGSLGWTGCHLLPFPTGVGDKKGGGVTTGGGDVERLRKAVQVLVQQTGPLGTCMDYIQEDVGIMVMELHRWEEECRKCVSCHASYSNSTRHDTDVSGLTQVRDGSGEAQAADQ